METVLFENGQVIMKEGEEPVCLYYLTKGRAKVQITQENGKISFVNFLNGPCFIGEMEFFQAQICSNQVTAVTDCVCYVLKSSEYRERLLADTEFLKDMCMYLSKKAVQNTDHYSRNQSFPLENRLAAFLLTASCNGCYRERHTEAAEYLGVSYRHFLYVLSDFVGKGFLEKTKQGYRIQNPEQLKRLAGELQNHGFF